MMHGSMNIKFVVINISAEGQSSVCAEVPIMIMTCNKDYYECW
jgi:hypothetical protein